MRNLLKRGLALAVLLCSFVVATAASAQAAPAPSAPAEQAQQLVAPIALYPDSLVAQILAASTNPIEIVQAWRWMRDHPDLQGQQLADAVDPQPWDPSVKALTQFPSVLQNLDANLSWTSALGDAYVNGPQDLLDAVQSLRHQAQAAGRLSSTSQQTVSTQGQTIVIEPADPQVVYVPAYDPWLVYGSPILAYPDWVGVPGVFYDGPDLYFGAGIGIGLFAGVVWGAHHWGLDWHDRRTLFDHEPYVYRGRTFAQRHDFDHGSEHGGHVPAFHDAGGERVPDVHPHVEAPLRPITHAGAFGGFDNGGVVRGYADRGRASFGGGFHASGPPGGGFHGGGFRGEGAGAHGGAGHR